MGDHILLVLDKLRVDHSARLVARHLCRAAHWIWLRLFRPTPQLWVAEAPVRQNHIWRFCIFRLQSWRMLLYIQRVEGCPKTELSKSLGNMIYIAPKCTALLIVVISWGTQQTKAEVPLIIEFEIWNLYTYSYFIFFLSFWELREIGADNKGCSSRSS